MPIHFFTEDIDFAFAKTQETSQWIETAITDYKCRLAEEQDLNFIFCSDAHLHKINVEYLNHDTLTDIITFDQAEYEGEIAGDIFISVERVADNAEEFGVSFEQELNRVIIHGVLHLLGLSDKTPEQEKEMRKAENHYLAKIKTV